jgi:hypothetical protein
MKEKMFDVEKEKYISLEPFWDILRNSPQGEVDIDKAIEQAGLEKSEAVDLIKQLLKEFNTKIGFNLGGMKNLMGLATATELTLEELAHSYLFDKVMLLNRCRGMNLDAMFIVPPLNQLRDLWIEKQGI